MGIDIVSARLIRIQLETGINQLERNANNRLYNTLCIRTLGHAAKVLGHQEFRERTIRLLRFAPEGVFRAGMISLMPTCGGFHHVEPRRQVDVCLGGCNLTSSGSHLTARSL
jgi:hypothetical protein